MARPRQRRRKCQCCRAWFTPDPRKRGQQRYCSEERCRKASKAASQRRWLRNSENEIYFHGSEHVDRVQRWRRAHPGYWRRKIAPTGVALQDVIDMQPVEPASKSGRLNGALQDVMAVPLRWRLQRPGRRLDQAGLAVGVHRVNQPGPAGSS
jgi:hypothetical protein